MNRRVRTGIVKQYADGVAYGFVFIYEQGVGIYACMVAEL